MLRQIETRAEVTGRATEPDEGANYRDYLLATGKMHAVWELVNTAFRIAGYDLEWDLEGNDPSAWGARFRSAKLPAVVVKPDLLRTAEPLVINVDPGRARKELGWAPRQGLEVFLTDMFKNSTGREALAETAGQ